MTSRVVSLSVLCVIILLPLTWIDSGLAQCQHPATRTWIRVENRIGFAHTLWFGFDSTATEGIDPHLCEFELPPIPPTCPWWNPAFRRIRPSHNLGLGTWFDYRPYVSRTQVDTHVVFFGWIDTSCNSGHPTVLHWSSNHVAALCDSAIIFYGGRLRARMDIEDSVVVTDPDIMSLRIIKYGAIRTVVRVSEEPLPSFSNFALYQNYPNPFNPGTIIRFEVPRSTFVTLKVYDLLGQEVATLVNEPLGPGTYERTFNAEGLASGVYLYRLTAGEFLTTKKLIMMR